MARPEVTTMAQRTPTTDEVRAYLRATGTTLRELRAAPGWPQRVLDWLRDQAKPS